MTSNRSSSGPELRDGFKFRSGHRALDLAATVAFRLRGEPRDLLIVPGDLDRWLRAAGLAVDGGAVAKPEELAAARELREALYRLALARVRSQELAATDLEILNAWAAEPPPAASLDREGRICVHGSVRNQLAALARGGVELLGGPLASRIRECAGTTCAILFVDASRSGERRWCSMASCGNKAKVSAFRRRHGTS